jgi:hypothetical protein
MLIGGGGCRRGSFGTVYKAVWRGHGVVAVKRVNGDAADMRAEAGYGMAWHGMETNVMPIYVCDNGVSWNGCVPPGGSGCGRAEE